MSLRLADHLPGKSAAAVVLLLLASTWLPAAAVAPVARTLEYLVTADPDEAQALLESLPDQWDRRAVPMVLDTLHLSRSALVSLGLVRILEKQTGVNHGANLGAWWEWMWRRPPIEHPDYPAFKSRIYGVIDEKFSVYFGPDRPATIRLDEVVWGGVLQDGIPPLRDPELITAADADWLDDNDVVFGIAINGDTRAYPKRILAWHEMVTDTVGGKAVAGVYCTLCGAMILYYATHDGVQHELGTSGFLYRSNKLMYDRATHSLWSTLGGEPVIGPLVGKGIRLARGSVVTTTWREWRRRHPNTAVLSLATGYTRDYSEGAAYREYFSTDALMFEVPQRDGRLANKAEVVGLLFPHQKAPPLALCAEYLARRPIHHDAVGDVDLVVVTDRSGANRVYERGGITFTGFDGTNTLRSEDGRHWTLSEDSLESGNMRLLRLPAHRAFWFGWYAAYPKTRLVH